MNAKPLTVAAATLTNACGIGWKGVREALRASSSGLRPLDLEWAPPLATHVGRVRALEAAAERGSLDRRETRNNRLAALCLEQDGFSSAVARAAARLGKHRIGVFLGTTTSGIQSTELAYRAWKHSSDHEVGKLRLDRNAHNMHATTAFVRTRLALSGPAQTVSTACSSSAKVFAAAARFIASGLCDAAVVGGVDSLALSTLFGFKALDLVSPQPCRPFAVDRDGISIGEAAGFALLEPGDNGEVALLGWGESADAWHMSAPHPEGAGAASAMRAALAMADLEPARVDYINLHGTASRANDAAEDRAVVSVFGRETPVSSTKGSTGHALGAAGITEALITVLAIADQWLPGTVGCRRRDPALAANVLIEPRSQRVDFAMSNSFGFGGSNCALLFGKAA